MKKNYTKVILDLAMAITFVLLMNPRVLNGLPFHEIAGVIIGVAILVHIGLNYHWVVITTKKIFDPKLPKKTRVSYFLNILLLVSMATVIVTGILISRVVFPSLAVEGSHSIRELHGLSADATLAFVGLHVGVHWQWIMSICKKAFKTKEGKYRKGVLASVVLSLSILTGGIQWYGSTVTPANGDFKHEQMVSSSNGTSVATTNTDEDSPKGDFHEGKFGDRDGKEGHGGSESPFLVVLNYFAIWAAIIVPTYYVEKRLLRKKRKSRVPGPQTS